MSKFSYYVHVAYKRIIITPQNEKPNDFTTIGLFDPLRLNTDSANICMNYDNQDQVTQKLETWFKEGKFIIFNETKINIHLSILSDCPRFQYNDYYCIGYYDNNSWIIAYDNDNNLAIYGYFTCSPKLKQFGTIKNCQAARALKDIKYTESKHLKGTVAHYIFDCTLRQMIDVIGDITVTDNTRYIKLISSNAAEPAKISDETVKVVKVDEPVKVVKVDEPVKGEPVVVDSSTKQVENIADKYCQMALEYYLDHAFKLFSVESVLSKVQETSGLGVMYLDLSLVNNIDISVAFKDNSSSLKFDGDVRAIIHKLYDNLKNKLEIQGFSVERHPCEISINWTPSRELIDKLKKKYAC